jgi:hypothetical protein
MAQIAEKGRRPIVTRTVTFLLSLCKMCWRKQLCSTYNHRATSRLYTGLPSRDVRIHGEFWRVTGPPRTLETGAGGVPSERELVTDRATEAWYPISIAWA